MTMFSLTEDSKGKSLALFFENGDSETIPETHVSFKTIIEQLLSGTSTDEKIRELTQVLQTVTRKMSAISERVSVDGNAVYFDGDPLRGEVSDIIKKMFEEGRALDFKPLVNFLEKAATNPSLKSVDDLYRWISKGDLVIDPDGDIVAYKGVSVRSDGVSVSVHSGTAFVNGEEIKGQIPNVPGTVISMPRSAVNANEMIACSTGLHAGTYAYASSFASRLILVKINPRDVVSVPKDSSDQKLRVSRYTVLSQIDNRLQSVYYQPTLDEDVDEEDEDGYDYEYDENFLEDDEDDLCDCGCEDDYEEDEDEEEVEPAEQDVAEYFTAVLNKAVPVKPEVPRDASGRRVFVP